MRHPCDQCGKPDTRFTDLFSEYLCADCPLGTVLTDEEWERLVTEQRLDEQEKGAP